MIEDTPEFDKERYFVGSLCKNGHDWFGTGGSLRKIKKHDCIECKKLADKRWKQENPEKVSVSRTKYNQQDRVKEYKRKHWSENSEKYRAEKRKRYEENKPEILAKNRAYHLRHRDKTLQYLRGYHRANRDRFVARSRDYYAENKVELLAKGKQYREENQEVIRERRKGYRTSLQNKMLKKAADNRRRTRKKNNHAVMYSRDELSLRLDAFSSCCAYCKATLDIAVPRQLTWDHFIPIVSGGPDCMGNLVPACHFCNSSKSDRDPWEWYKSQPFYKSGHWKAILKALGKTQADYSQIPLL